MCQSSRSGCAVSVDARALAGIHWLETRRKDDGGLYEELLERPVVKWQALSLDEHHQDPTDKQGQPHEVTPFDRLFRNEDSDQDTEFVDGDDHTDLDFS